MSCYMHSFIKKHACFTITLVALISCYMHVSASGQAYNFGMPYTTTLFYHTTLHSTLVVCL